MNVRNLLHNVNDRITNKNLYAEFNVFVTAFNKTDFDIRKRNGNFSLFDIIVSPYEYKFIHNSDYYMHNYLKSIGAFDKNGKLNLRKKLVKEHFYKHLMLFVGYRCMKPAKGKLGVYPFLLSGSLSDDRKKFLVSGFETYVPEDNAEMFKNCKKVNMKIDDISILFSDLIEKIEDIKKYTEAKLEKI